jgi:predicted aconitase with swiveling domain
MSIASAAPCPILVAGTGGSGPALVLEQPVSFWGGVDPVSGCIIDVRHPQHGACVSGTVLFLSATIGSSSAASVMLELVHRGAAPVAIIMGEPDAILLAGLVVAREMGWPSPVALTLGAAQHAGFAGRTVTVTTERVKGLLVAADGQAPGRGRGTADGGLPSGFGLRGV